MSERKYTPEQQNAIDAAGRSIIVSAAAGSGKTSVLVERLLKMICDTENKTPVESIVVVTFTRAAAAEMKQRLSLGLSAKLSKTHNDWLERQSSLLSTAHISTIHSFCFDLIRENIAALDLASDFRIADETEEKLFTDAVMNELMDELYRESPDDMKLLLDNFCGSSDKKLTELIRELHSCVSAIPFFENYLKALPKKYSDDIYTELYIETVEKKLRYCAEKVREVLKVSERLGDEKLTAVLSDDLYTMEKAEELFSSKDYIGLLDFLGSVQFTRFPTNKKGVPDPDKRAEIKTVRDSYKKSVSGFSELRSILFHAPEDLERHGQIVRVLSDIIIKYDRKLLEYKFEKNAVCFDDAETLTLRLLAASDESGRLYRTPLGDEISGYYSFIMVDEFQDTNDRQDMIFRLISKNGSPESYGENLFFVGDVKQSIYRFRQANPDNFLNVQNSFVPYGSDMGNQGACIKLNRNFRSSPEVIDFVNFVFKNIMSLRSGGVDYDSDSFLVNGAEFAPADRAAEIILYEEDKDNEAAEAEAAARRIRQMLDSGAPVSSRGSTRPCIMKDFCILTRSKTKNNIYADALEKFGLDVIYPDVSGYLESREISVLINLLKIVDNPLLDIPAASVMMSPMFLFSPDEMTKIRLVDKDKKLCANIIRLTSDEELQKKEPELSGRLKKFRAFIADLRVRCSFCSLPELIEFIYDKTDFASVIQLTGNAERRRANLRLLLDYADRFEKNYASGVHGFVKYIVRVQETGGNFGSFDSGTSSKNAVSIKTMHASKGLEFPFVFIVGTGTKFNKQDEKKIFQFSEELGVGFRLQNKDKLEKFTTLPFEVVKAHAAQKAKDEEMRLLYVALTRAGDKLFITMDTSEKTSKKALSIAERIRADEGITAELSRSAESMSDWFLMVLLLHPLGAPLREKFKIFESFRSDDSFPISFTADDPGAEYSPPGSDADSDRRLDDAVMTELHRRFSFVYKNEYGDAISKFAVSDLIKHDDSEGIILQKPAFACEGGHTAAERGTAVHCFLQFADFSRLVGNFESERDRMMSRGHITPAQAEIVCREDIEAFTDSGLFRLIGEAEDVLREHRFLVSIADLGINEELGVEYKGTDGMLAGIIDMVLVYKDYLILVDYKTDRGKSPSELVRAYKKQLELYKKALEVLQDKPVKESYIYSFSEKREIKLF